METQSLIPRLVAEFGYPEKGAKLVADKLVSSAPEIQSTFLIWWQNGEIMDLAVEGYTVSQLMAEHQMNPVAAFLTLDWLKREPEAARISLAKGHDRLVQR